MGVRLHRVDGLKATYYTATPWQTNTQDPKRLDTGHAFLVAFSNSAANIGFFGEGSLGDGIRKRQFFSSYHIRFGHGTPSHQTLDTIFDTDLTHYWEIIGSSSFDSGRISYLMHDMGSNDGNFGFSGNDYRTASYSDSEIGDGWPFPPPPPPIERPDPYTTSGLPAVFHNGEWHYHPSMAI
jgi:hypothetical protein